MDLCIGNFLPGYARLWMSVISSHYLDLHFYSTHIIQLLYFSAWKTTRNISICPLVRIYSYSCWCNWSVVSLWTYVTEMQYLASGALWMTVWYTYSLDPPFSGLSMIDLMCLSIWTTLLFLIRVLIISHHWSLSVISCGHGRRKCGS